MITEEEVKKRAIKSIGELTDIIAKKEKEIKKLKARITFLEGSVYGKSLINRGIEQAIIRVLLVLKKYPRVPKKLKNELMELKEIMKKEG